MNGRPDENNHCAYFYSTDHKQHIASATEIQDAPGHLKYSGQINKENECHGNGKYWYDSGDIFIGE